MSAINPMAIGGGVMVKGHEMMVVADEALVNGDFITLDTIPVVTMQEYPIDPTGNKEKVVAFSNHSYIYMNLISGIGYEMFHVQLDNEKIPTITKLSNTPTNKDLFNKALLINDTSILMEAKVNSNDYEFTLAYIDVDKQMKFTSLKVYKGQLPGSQIAGIIRVMKINEHQFLCMYEYASNIYAAILSVDGNTLSIGLFVSVWYKSGVTLSIKTFPFLVYSVSATHNYIACKEGVKNLFVLQVLGETITKVYESDKYSMIPDSTIGLTPISHTYKFLYSTSNNSLYYMMPLINDDNTFSDLKIQSAKYQNSLLDGDAFYNKPDFVCWTILTNYYNTTTQITAFTSTLCIFSYENTVQNNHKYRSKKGEEISGNMLPNNQYVRAPYPEVKENNVKYTYVVVLNDKVRVVEVNVKISASKSKGIMDGVAMTTAAMGDVVKISMFGDKGGNAKI